MEHMWQLTHNRLGEAVHELKTHYTQKLLALDAERAEELTPGIPVGNLWVISSMCPCSAIKSY